MRTAFASIVFLLAAACASAAASVGPFTDVSAESPLRVPLEFLKEHGVIAGYEDGSFHPERSVNRAEALAMILKATGKGEDSESAAGTGTKEVTSGAPLQITLPENTRMTVQNLATGETETLTNVTTLNINAGSGTTTVALKKQTEEKPFQDVSEKDWFFGVVMFGKKSGVVKGKKDGKYFRPKQAVNLAETLRMLFSASETNTALSEAPLPPRIPAGAWFAKDFAHAVSETMLLQQINGNVFPPQETLNRGEIATLLYRFLATKEGSTFGYASWYGDGLAKTKLTSGTEYAERSLTAAHLTYPFGTILRATNVANGKSVDVVVNDRGPFVTGRIIDLSKSAFSALETPSSGVISVKVEVMK